MCSDGGLDNRVEGVYFYHSYHLGSASWITKMDSAIYSYMPYGEMIANQAPLGYDERYKFTGKERDTETGYDYFGARYYSSSLPQWLSVDPLTDKYPSISPYAYCNWNPIKYVDPNGRDWYELEGEIKWTDYKSQQDMNHANIEGTYLGEAAVLFDGYYDEKLGKGNNLWGEGAKLATATVYGPGGENDITTYDAFTMSSNFNEYGAIIDGDYTLDYVKREGSMGSHWAINNGGAVDCVGNTNNAWYKHKETNPYSSTQKNGTFVHRSNRNGDMLPIGKDGKYHPLSTGCLIIAPSKSGTSGWNEFNNQLQGVKKALLRIKRQ